MTKYNRELIVAQKAAKSAGEQIVSNAGNLKARRHGLEFKAEVDRLCDATIKKIIQTVFPNDSILTEESGFLKKAPERLWVVDPLDGTTNFLNGSRFCSCLIAFIDKREIVIGVSYLPFSDELFYATKDSGAYIKNKKLSVSTLSDIKRAVVIIDPGYHHQGNKKIAETYLKLKSKVGNIGIHNGNGYTLSLMARGEFAGFIHLASKIWECAGLFIFQEAGGTVTDFSGKEINLNFSKENTFEFVATNGLIHNDLLKLVNN